LKPPCRLARSGLLLAWLSGAASGAGAEFFHLGFEPQRPSAADPVALVVAGTASCPAFGVPVVEDFSISLVYLGDFCLFPPIPFNRVFFLGFLPAGTYAARLDSEAGDTLLVAELTVSEAPSDCASDAGLCLHGGRFAVEALWRTREGGQGEGVPLPLSPETGAFTFFAPGNVELVVKVLAGCDVNQRFWVFAAGLTDVEVRLRVTDTATGFQREYFSPAGRPFAPIQDTAAFAICPVVGPPPP
jgi:hypothetical protein